MKIIKNIYFALSSVPDYFHILLVQLGVIEKYQPLWKISEKGSERQCQDRWDSLKKHWSPAGGSFIDVGSQLGFFTLSAARDGAIAMGFERVYQFFRVAKAVANINKVKNVTFFNLEMNAQTISALPSVKTICFMSVFHHWVLDWGEETACKMLKDLSSKTEALIFETGQPNETSQEFSKHLGFMGEDYVGWVVDKLKEYGFSEVILVGEFETHLSDTKRTLFLAKK